MSEPAQTQEASSQAFPLKQKLVATTLHLLVSAAFVGALLALVMQVWYPGFLFGTDGGWQGLRIVILVDLVLGPLLTFVVYKRGKKGLVLDLVLIAIMQLAALLGGGWIVYSERPLMLVFHEARFYSVTADDYLEVGVPVPDFSGLTSRPPDYAVIVPPESPITQSAVRTAYVQRGQYLYTHVPWMRPSAEHLDEVLAAAVPREELLTPPDLGERTEAFEAWQADTGLALEDVALVPYSSRFRVVYLVVERSTGRILHDLDISSR